MSFCCLSALVVQRPANAIKELVENSLDAGATSVTVVVAEGGLRSFSVQDDGHGIRREDLPILCERHTTSKLNTFEDLRTLGTFGFRGEALASISHVANVTVTTMTASQPCGYRAQYRDGVLEEGRQPLPCAGNRGTMILAENLFYNLKQRREALKIPAEEMKKIADVVRRYALHFSGKCFVLKKAAPGSQPEVFTQRGATLATNVSALFGQETGENLIQCSESIPELEMSVDAAVTCINHGGKRYDFILFINHRLVECKQLKRMVREVYSNLLIKHKNPFVYLSLTLKPENVDVNIHPTKQTVRFRNEDEVLTRIANLIERQLKSNPVSRPFKVTSTASLVPAKTGNDDPQWRAVRVDSREQRLDSFLVREPSSASSQVPLRAASLDVVADEISMAVSDSQPSQSARSQLFAPSAASQMQQQQHRAKRCRTQLSSVHKLLEQIESSGHSGLADLFREHSFVGCCDANKCAIQHRLNLYLVDVPEVCTHFLYQCILEQFEHLNRIRISQAPSVRSLLRLHLECVRTKVSFAGLPVEQQDDLLSQMEAILKPVRLQMMRLYFSIDITDDLRVTALPSVIPGFKPDMIGLPRFIFRLCTKINYNDEKECFRSIATELASFLSPPPLNPPFLAPGEKDIDDRDTRAHQIEHVLFGAMKTAEFRPPKHLGSSGAVRQIASIDQLYKTFERC